MLVSFVAAWCKPAKNSEGVEYSDDDPPGDYGDPDSQPDYDDDYPGTIEEPPQIVSRPEGIHVRNGSTIWLHCLLKNTGSYDIESSRSSSKGNQGSSEIVRGKPFRETKLFTRDPRVRISSRA